MTVESSCFDATNISQFQLQTIGNTNQALFTIEPSNNFDVTKVNDISIISIGGTANVTSFTINESNKTYVINLDGLLRQSESYLFTFDTNTIECQPNISVSYNSVSGAFEVDENGGLEPII